MSDVLVGKRRARSYVIDKTKNDLRNSQLDVSKISDDQMKAIIFGFLQTVESLLESGDSVCLGPGTIGTLEIIRVSERKGRDIGENKSVCIPARGRLRVKPTSKLRDKLLTFNKGGN